MNDLAQDLAKVLKQTSEDHHVAFKDTDGVDPDWSIWYAGHLLELGFDKMLDATILKSDLIYLLVRADKEQTTEAPGGDWARYYARHFIEKYLP